MTSLAAAFFVSGASALLFEVYWIRQVTLSIGSSPIAFALVSSLSVLGLGVGAWVFPQGIPGLRSGRWAGPVMAEAASGLSNALLPEFPFLTLPSLFLVSLFAGFVVAAVTEAWKRFPAADRKDIGPLYAWNFLGGGFGVALGGFLLLPVAGVSSTRWVALALSVLSLPLFVAAFRGGGRFGPVADPVPVRRFDFVPSALVAVTGATGMGLEILWGRWISQMAGSSVYTYFSVLAVTIVAFGAGCLFPRENGGGRRRLYAFLSLTVAYPLVLLVALLSLRGFEVSPYRAVAAWAGGSPPLAVLSSAILVLSPMLFGSGLFFSFAVGGGLSDRPPAHRTLFMSNCLGASAGALLVPFALIPAAGTGPALAAVCASNLLPAAVMALRAEAGGRRSGVRTVLAAVPFLAAAAFWLAGRPAYFLLPREGMERTGREAPWGTSAEFFDEGPFSTVIVGGERGHEVLVVDGKPESHARRDRPTQTMLAQLPFLLKGETFRDVLLIGLGSGATLDGILLHPVRTVDCVEISPEVVRAVREGFGRRYAPALSRPGVRVIVGDGRRFLREAGRRYDLLVSQPSNPWVIGASSLFTREAFLAMERVLSPGGVAVIWFQTYGVSPEDLRVEYDTVRSVFPSVLAFSFSPGDILLVCSVAPLGVDMRTLGDGLSALPIMSYLKRETGISTPAEFLGGFLGGVPPDGARNREWNTDDRPVLEYRMARSVALRDPYPPYAVVLEPLKGRAARIAGLPPEGTRARGEFFLEWGEAASRMGLARFAEEPFREALRLRGVDSRTLNDLGIVRFERKEYNQASRYFDAALRLDPMNSTARENLLAIGRER
ncbi:MAG: spermine/spermidine synthase domain-containing protein [Desulfobacteria bacterium]